MDERLRAGPRLRAAWSLWFLLLIIVHQIVLIEPYRNTAKFIAIHPPWPIRCAGRPRMVDYLLNARMMLGRMRECRPNDG